MLTFKGDIDHGVLQHELIAAIGTQQEAGWYLNGAQGEVTFIATKDTTPDPTAVITAHIAAGSLSRLKKQLLLEVDDYIGSIFMRPQRFLIEYQEREAAARAYQEAGYSGEQDASIVEFSSNNGMPYAQAVDLIITQADGLRGAVKPLGTLRMRKGRIENAGSAAVAIEVKNAILAEARAIAVQLGLA